MAEEETKPISTFSRRVSIKDILEHEDLEIRTGDYIQVVVVHNFGPKDRNYPGLQCCNLILADDSSRIFATIYLNDNEPEFEEAQALVEKLKEGTKHRITDFQIKETRPGCQYNPVVDTEGFELVLKKSTATITDIPEDDQSNLQYLTAFPFSFKKLEDVPNCRVKEFIDVIGFATSKSAAIKSGPTKYKKIELGSSRKNSEGHRIFLRLYEEHMNDITKVNEVYAFANVQANQYMNSFTNYPVDMFLQVVNKTAIFKVTSVDLLPEEYRNEEFVTGLFPPTTPPAVNENQDAGSSASKRPRTFT